MVSQACSMIVELPGNSEVYKKLYLVSNQASMVFPQAQPVVFTGEIATYPQIIHYSVSLIFAILLK
jgi:hypothetical protein